MPAAEKGYAENGMGSQAMAQAQGNAETDKQLDQLKHIVSRTLEAKGVLGTIRAQLRAAVFTALDEQERASGVYLENNRVQKIKESDEGRLLAGLLHECFEFYELDRTLSVFMPETTWALEDYSGRQQLSAKLGLEPDAPSPLLLQILRDRLTMGSRSATKPERKSVASSISSCTTSPLSKSESRGVERSPVSANTSEIGSPPSARSSRQSSVASRSPRSGNTDSRSSERKPFSSSSTATSPSAADARLPSTRLKSSSGFSDGALDTKPVIMANVAAPMLSGTIEQEIAQSKTQFDPEFYMSSPSSREAELRARKDEMFSPADRSSIAEEEEESKLTIKDTWSGSMSSPSVVEDIAESDNQLNSYRSQSPSFEEHAQLQEPLSGKSHASNFSKSTSHSEEESENFHQGLSIVGEQDDDDAEAIRGLDSQSKSQLKASPISSSPYSFGSDMGEFGVQLDLKSNTQPIAEYDNDNEEDSENEDSDMGSHSDQAIEESASHQSESPNIGDNMQLQEPLSSKSRSSKLSKSASNGSHLEDEEESYGRDMAEDGDSNEFEEEEVESLASQSQSSHKASPMSSSPYSFESDTEGFGVQLGSKPPVPAISGSGDGKDEVESSHGDENSEDSISHRSDSPVIGDKMQSQEPLSGKSGSSKLSKSTFSVNHSEDEEEELELENLASQSKPHSKATPMSSSPYSFESDVEGFGVQLGSKPLTQATTEDDNNDEKDDSEDEDQSVSRHDAEDNEESASHHSESLSFEDHVEIQEPLSGKSRSSKLSKSASNVSHSEDEEESCDHDMAEDGGNDGDEVESLASQSQLIHEAFPMNSSRFSFESDMEGFGVQLGSKPPVSAIAASGDGKDEVESSHEDENTEESVNYHRESPVIGDNMQLQEPLSGKSHSSDHSKIASPLNLSEHEEEIDDNGRMKEEEQYDAHNDEEEEDVESLLSQRKLIQKASPMGSSPYSFESDMEGFGVQLGSKPLTQATTEDDNNDGKDDSEDEDQSVSRHDAEDNEESTSHHSESPSFEDHAEIQEPLSGKSRSSKLSKSASNVSHSEDEEESYEEDHELEEDGDNDDNEEEEVESLASQSQPIHKASPMSSSPYSFESDMEGFGVQLGSKPLTQATTEEDSNDEKEDSGGEDIEESTSHHSESPSFEDHVEIQEPLSGKSRSSKLSKSASNVSHSEDEEESYEEDHELEEDGDNDDNEEEEVESLASQSQPIHKASPMSSSPYSFESDMEGFGVQLGSKPLTQATTEEDSNDEKEDSGGEDIEESTSHHSESPSFEDHVEIQEPLSGKSRSSKLSKSASNVSHSEDEEESYEEDHELKEDGDNDDSEEEEVESLASQSQPIHKASPVSSSPYSFESDMEGFGVQLGSKPLTQATTEEDSNDEKDDSEDEDNEKFASHHSEAPSFEDHLEIQEPLSGKSHSSKIYKSTSNGIHSEDEEESYDYDMTEDGGNDEVESSHVDEDAEDSGSHRSESSDIADNIQLQEPLSGKSHSSKLSNESHSEDEEENYGRELTEDVSNEEDEEVEKIATSNHESSRLSSSPYSFESDTEGFGVQLGSKPLAQANTKDDSDSDSEGEDGDFDVKNHTAKDLRESNSRHSESPAIGDNMQLQEPPSAKSHSSKLSKSASRASHLEDEEEDYNHDMAEDSDNVNNENGEVESISSQSRSILKASPTSSSPNSLESGMEGFGVQFGSKPLPQFIAKDSTDSEGDDEDGDFSANNRTSEDASEFHSHGSKSPATGNNTQVQEPLSGKSRSSEVSKSISNAGHSDEEDDEESYNHELANEEEQDDDNDDIEEEAERFAFQSKSIHKGSPMSSSPSSFGSDMEVEGFGVHFGSKSPAQAIAKDGDGMEDENRSETESVSPHSREAAGREEAAQKPSLSYDYQNNSFLTQDIISKATEGTPTIDSVQHSLHEDSDGGEFSVSPKEDHERQSNFSQFSDEDQAGVGPLRTSSRDQYSHSTNHEGSIDSHNVEEAEHTNDESEDEEDFSFAPSSGVHKHFHMDNTVGGSHPYSEKVNASKSEEGNQSDVHESVTRDQNKGYGKAHERLASSGRVGLLSSETNEGSFRGSVHSYLQEEEHEEDAGSLSESSHSDKGKVVEYGKAPHAAIADRNSLVEASSTQEEPYSSMGSFDASFDSDEEFGVNIANVIGNKDDVSLSDYSNKVGVNEAEDRKSLETRNDHSNFSKNSMLDEDSDEDKGEGDESDDEYGEDFEDDFEEEEDEEGAEGSVLHNEEISVPSEVESVASLESGSCELSNDGGSKISTEDAKDAEDRSEDTPVAHIKIDLDEQIVESIEFGVSETALQDQCDDIF